MDLAGKHILVTGGTDGIGAQLIRQLRDAGASVVTTGLNPERIAATQAEGFEVISADLSTAEGVAGLVEAMAGRPLDVLVNNAGMGDGEHDHRNGTPDADYAAKAVSLNLTAPIRLITALMPALREAGAQRGGGMVVNVTSGLAIAPRGGGPVYCATKAGLRSYTQGLRHQLKALGVHVMEALPPMVDTRMTAGRSDSNKMSAPECARQIVAGMKANANEVNVGIVKALQAVHSLSPALARRILINF
ncbi:MAG: SDR family NAD(P)-dependent oxidoreductase [Proteobacteria bacterium]|nr:SDR family NAD(P)-dependent oxidoreductase [Pseudomonadota bacterium]